VWEHLKNGTKKMVRTQFTGYRPENLQGEVRSNCDEEFTVIEELEGTGQ
jgi:hypothetical protein